MADFPRIAMAESMVTQPQYKLMRTLTAQTAETDPPVAGSFTISIPRSNYADIVLAMSAVGGTVNADQIVFSTYRMMRTKAGTNFIDGPIDRYVMDAAKYATPVIRTVRSSCRNLWTVVTFVGGTSPTVSGSIYVRGVHDAGLTSNDFPKDPDGYPIFRALAFDPVTGALLVNPVRDISDNNFGEAIVDLSGTNVVTATYDIDMTQHSDWSIVMTWAGDTGVTNLLKVAVLGCNDPEAASPLYAVITGEVYDWTNGAYLLPDATGDVTAPTPSATVGWSIPKCPYRRIRIRVTCATPDADSVLKILSHKRFGG